MSFPGSALVARLGRGPGMAALAVVALIVTGDFEVRQRDDTAALGGSFDLVILVEIAVYVAVGAWFYLMAVAPRGRALPRLLSAMWMLVGILALSALWAPSLTLSGVRAMQLIVVAGMATFHARRADSGHFHAIARAYVYCVTAFMAIGLVWRVPSSAITAHRFNWAATHPVTSAALLSVSILILVAWTRRPRSETRLTPATVRLLLIAQIGALAATQTRGSIVAVMVGALTWAWYSFERRRKDMLILGVLGLPLVAIFGRSLIQSFLLRGESTEQLTSLNSRTSLWTEAFSIVAESPLIGRGYFSARELFLESVGLGGAHNAYIEVLVSAGIIGGVLMMAVLVFTGVGIHRLVGHPDQGLLAGLFATQLVTGLTAQYWAQAGTGSNVWFFVLIAWVVVARRETESWSQPNAMPAADVAPTGGFWVPTDRPVEPTPVGSLGGTESPAAERSESSTGSAHDAATRSDESDKLRKGRSSAWALVGTAVGAVANFIMLLVVSATYGTTVFGVFSAVTALFQLSAVVFRLGAEIGCTFFIARARAEGRGSDASRILFVGLAPVLVVSATVGLGVWVAADWVAQTLADPADVDAYRTMVRIVALALPAATLGEVLMGATRGFDSMRPTVIGSNFGRQCGQLVLVGAAAAFSDDLSVLAIAWSLPWLAAVVYPAWWLRGALAAADVSGGVHPWSRFWRYSTPQAANAVVQGGLEKVDVILLGRMAGADPTAVYALANRFVHVVVLARYALNASQAASFAEEFARGDKGRIDNLYVKVATWSALLCGPALWLFAVFPESILTVVGSQYADGSSALSILAVAMIGALYLGPAESALLMSGRSTRAFLNNAVGLVVNVALNLWLIPRHGPVGAGLAWAVSLFISRGLSAAVLSADGLLKQRLPLLRALMLTGAFYGVAGLTLRVLWGDSRPALVATALLGTLGLAVAVRGRRSDLRVDELIAGFVRRSDDATDRREDSGAGDPNREDRSPRRVGRVRLSRPTRPDPPDVRACDLCCPRGGRICRLGRAEIRSGCASSRRSR